MEPEISLGILHLYIDQPSVLCMKQAAVEGAARAAAAGTDLGDTADGEIAGELLWWRQWQVHFADETDPDTWIVGRLRFTPSS